MGTRKAIATPPRRAAITRALFLELVLDLVIFAICAVICLQVFGAARVESTRSAALSQLGIEAQGLAELFKASYGDTAALEALPNVQREGDALVWYYDQNLLPVDGAGGADGTDGASGTDGVGDRSYFVLRCTVDNTGAVKQARITLLEGATPALATPLFEYQVSSYRPVGGDGT
jgi:hypothetical protein